MPNQNIGLRIDAELLAMVDDLAGELDTSRTTIIIEALKQRLGVATGNTVEQRLADVEQRLATVEQRLASAQQRKTSPNRQGIATMQPVVNEAPKQPSQDAQQAASSPLQVSQHPTESEGLTIGAALVEAGAEISEDHAMGSNRDQRMVTRYGMKASVWLESQGWVKRGRKWFKA